MPDPTRLIQEMLTETQVPIPKKLKDALDAHGAATSEAVEQIDIDDVVRDVKAGDVPDLIAEVARRRALNPAAILKSEAYINVRDGLGRRVNREFSPIASTVFDAYQPTFDATALTMIEAAWKLPDTLKLDAAASQGTETLAAWGLASEAATQLDHLAKRYDWLFTYFGRIPTRLDQAARFCGFTDRDLVEPIMGAERVHPFGRWVSLVRLGVDLRWGALGAGDELAARWAAEDAAQAQDRAAENEAEVARVRKPWDELAQLGAERSNPKTKAKA